MNSGKNRPEGKQGRLITSQAQQEHHCQDMNGQSYQSFLESTLTYKTTPKSPGKWQINKVSVKFHCLAVKTYTESFLLLLHNHGMSVLSSNKLDTVCFSSTIFSFTPEESWRTSCMSTNSCLAQVCSSYF